MFHPKMSWWMISRSGFIRKHITILINDLNQIKIEPNHNFAIHQYSVLSMCWDLNQTWSKVEFSSRIIVETRVGLIHQRDTYILLKSDREKNALGPWKGLGTPKTQFSEILNLMNKLQFPFSYFKLYPDFI